MIYSLGEAVSITLVVLTVAESAGISGSVFSGVVRALGSVTWSLSVAIVYVDDSGSFLV